MAELTSVPWEQFPRKTAPDDLVSPHCRFVELTKSALAAGLGSDGHCRLLW